MSWVDLITAVLLLLACSLTLLASVGLVRFGSVFARIHPVTKAITLGVVTVCIAAALQVERAGEVTSLLLVAIFQILTAPIAAHMVARAAYRSDPEFSHPLEMDELRERLDQAAADETELPGLDRGDAPERRRDGR